MRIKWAGPALRVMVHLGAFLPIVWLALAITQGALGGDPVKELTHFLGMGAIRLLLLSLLITPLVKILGWRMMTRLRRPLGLWAFVWAALHFLTWLWLDLGFQWGLIGSEIISRTYILVGFLAWLILMILAITSIPRAIRTLGKYWKPLHSWVYLALLLVLLHFVWSVKSGWIEPSVYIAIGSLLMIARHKKFIRKVREKRPNGWR